MAVGQRADSQDLWTDKKSNPEPMNFEPMNDYKILRRTRENL